MDLPPELRIIHEPVRLRIMSVLYRQNDVGFTALRETLEITAGNLSSHAAKLIAFGLLQSRDALTRGGFEKRYQITKSGVETFERYLASLESFLASAKPAPAPAVPTPTTAATAPASRSGTIVGALVGGSFFVASELAMQLLSDTSGSAYIGIGATGLVVAAIAPLHRLFRR